MCRFGYLELSNSPHDVTSEGLMMHADMMSISHTDS